MKHYRHRQKESAIPLSSQGWMVRRILVLVFGAAVAVAPCIAAAQGLADQQGAATVESAAKVPWRGSRLVYSNEFSLLSLTRTDPDPNEYYGMALIFMPRWFFTDAFSLSGMMLLQVELTDSDFTDQAREVTLSDAMIDANYAPSWMKIPVLDITVRTSLRLQLPTSLVSQGRTLLFALGPGFAISRSFQLRGQGKAFSSLSVAYGLRVNKYFHDYATGGADANRLGCAGVRVPECSQTGLANRDWRFLNSVSLALPIIDKLSFSGSALFINDINYGLAAGVTADGVAYSGTDGAHVAAVWSMFDLTYQMIDWMWLSVGVSTFYPVLDTNDGLRAPLLNRFSNLYFNVTIPVDKAIEKFRGVSSDSAGAARKSPDRTSAGRTKKGSDPRARNASGA